MTFVKATALSLSVAMTALLPQFAMAQATEAAATTVAISPDTIAAISAACATGDQAACLAAVQAALSTLAATYQGQFSLESLMGALTAEIAAQANGAIAAGNTGLLASLTAAVSAVRTVATNSGVSNAVLETLTRVVAALEAGEPVDLAAIAEGTGAVIEAPNAPASNF